MEFIDSRKSDSTPSHFQNINRLFLKYDAIGIGTYRYTVIYTTLTYILVLKHHTQIINSYVHPWMRWLLPQSSHNYDNPRQTCQN